MAGRVGGLDQAPRVRDGARAPRAQEHQRRRGGRGRVGGGVAVGDGGGGHWVCRSETASGRDEAQGMVGERIGRRDQGGEDARNLFGVLHTGTSMLNYFPF